MKRLTLFLAALVLPCAAWANTCTVRQAGAVDQTVYVEFIDNTTGLPNASRAYNDSGIDLEYVRAGAAAVDITEATQTAAGAHSDGGFVTVGHGRYRLDLPDAAVATGVPEVVIQGIITGYTMLPCAVALSPSVTVDEIDSGEIEAADFASGAIDATAIAADAIGASELATDAIGAAEIAAAAIGASELATDAIGTAEIAAGAIENADFATAPGAAGGLTIAGTNADFNVTANAAFAGGITITQSTSNTAGLSITGNGTGAGVEFTSGSGATGDALSLVSASTNGRGLNAAGSGTGAGLRAVGGATGHGISGVGGSTSGHGFKTGITSLATGSNPDFGATDGGVLQSATGTTAVLASATSYADDMLIGKTLEIIAGTGVGQSRAITDWVSTTDTATVDTWNTTPDNTSVYIVWGTAPSSGGGGGLDAAGVRAAIGLASANLDTQLSAIDDYVDTEVAAILDDTGTSGVQIPSGEIVAATFGAGAIDAAAIAADAIGASEIATDAIGAAELAANSITSSEVADGAIDAGALAADTLTAAKVAADVTTELQSGLATSASISALNNISAAQVNAEVVDALATDTYAEPGQGTPAATTSLAAKINYLFKAWRNRSTQTASQYSLYNDNATTIDQKSTFSDDTTTADRGEVATGP